MSEPFLAEIRIVGFTFSPRGWAFCDGQLLPINQNQALYALLGTTYGGDGRTTFGLPDLRGRTPIHKGSGNPLGQKGGTENHTLNIAEMPVHRHGLRTSNADADKKNPANSIWAAETGGTRYGSAPANGSMAAGSIAPVGSGQPHENMQPYLALHFVIALQGLFPPRN
jgi:microcystin-dependent protein